MHGHPKEAGSLVIEVLEVDLVVDGFVAVDAAEFVEEVVKEEVVAKEESLNEKR